MPIYFHQDGLEIHYDVNVRRFLKSEFSNDELEGEMEVNC